MKSKPFPPKAKILIFGLGLQGGGEGDIRYLLRHGYDLRITDKKSATQLSATISRLPPNLFYTLSEHKLEDIEWADYILVNPGVNLALPEIVYAQKLGKKITNRTTLFLQHSNLPVIGITGTRGKSTTTELIYRLLNKAYPNQILRGGNIPGISDLELLDQVDNKKYAVLELSCFQLEYFHLEKISPQYAVITNLYPDHLNRYENMTMYAYAKAGICNYQFSCDYVFVNGDNSGCEAIAKDATGQRIVYYAKDVKDGTYPHLLGMHNRENMSAALALSKVLHLPPSYVYETFTQYPGLPYRLEERALIKGVRYINDTTSTTPTATLKAIDALSGPITLILGGAEKNLPTDNLFQTLHTSTFVKRIIILGSQHNQAIKTALPLIKQKVIGWVDNMDSAVNLAAQSSRAGDIVLLSPAFASFDLFVNEFDRGNQFNEAVARLANKNQE